MAEQTLNQRATPRPKAVKRTARNPRGSVPPLLLAAAREVFLERGYAGATTREIALRAGASEPLLFRYFGSKANLFTASVVEPFDRFVAEFSTRWTARDDHTSPGSPAGEFVKWLYSSLRNARPSVMTLLAAHEHEEDLNLNLDGVGQLLDRLTDVVEHETRLRGWEATNMPIATRIIVGMVAAAALGKNWFFGGHPTPTDDEIIDEMISFIVNGFTRQANLTTTELHHDPELGRVVIRGPDAASVTTAINAWVTERAASVEICDLTWRDRRANGTTAYEAHIYYRTTPTGPCQRQDHSAEPRHDPGHRHAGS
jgi:AcrR family transcriptional regulator